MRRPPAHASPEARALREAAIEWVKNPGHSLNDTSDPDDTIGQRVDTRLLRAAAAYAQAADREGWLGPIAIALGVPVHVLDSFVVNYRRQHGDAAVAGRPQTDLDPALVAVALKGRSRREAAKMLGVNASVELVKVTRADGGISYTCRVKWPDGSLEDPTLLADRGIDQ